MRLAKSLVVLRDQIDALFPDRDRCCDGNILDQHRRTNYDGDHTASPDVARALYVTNDPAVGLKSHDLALSLMRAKDRRIRVVISQGQYFQGPAGERPWTLQPYHKRRDHWDDVLIMVRDEEEYFDDELRWKLRRVASERSAADSQERRERPILRPGCLGDDVKAMQKRLNAIGANIPSDGKYGDRTERAVNRFKAAAGLPEDGIVDAAVWQALFGPGGGKTLERNPP